MADLTVEQLYVGVARELKQIEIGEPLSAEDREVIEQKWNGLYGIFETRGWAQFPLEGPIGERYAICVEALLAAHCANAFQTEYTPVFDVVLEMNRAVMPDYRHAPTSFEDF